MDTDELVRHLYRIVSVQCERAGLKPEDRVLIDVLASMLAATYAAQGGGYALRSDILKRVSYNIDVADRMRGKPH